MKSKQVLVIGAGRFGTAIATTLYELGHEVVVVDADEARVEDIMNRVTHAVIMDATDEDALRKLGVNNFDTVVVAIGTNLEANILSTVALKALGAEHVISKVTSHLAAQVLKKVGADEVVRPEHDMGVRLAKQLVTPSMVDAFELGGGHEVIEVEAQERLLGKLKDLRLTNKFGVQVIAIDRGGKVEVSPTADSVIMRGDRVVIIGTTASIEKFREHLG